MTKPLVRFELVPDWEKTPVGEEYAHQDVAGVACDSCDRVYLHTRKKDQVLVYDEEGNFLRRWGDGVFKRAHGLTIAEDLVYATDDMDSVVRIFDLEGNFKWMLGEPGVVQPTGYGGIRGRPVTVHHNEFVERSAGPFNCCCNVAIAANGDIFVADGYGNARIHHFNKSGELQNSWGDVGTGPGQFHLPHGIALDNDENVIVCDRENDRLQFFTRDGKFLDQWLDVLRPTDVTVDKDGLIYVSELWRPTEPGQGSFRNGFPDHDLPGRVSVFHPDGTIAARWGADSENRSAPGNFIAPHGLALDSKGSLYVAEVSGSFGGHFKRLPMEEAISHQLQKFRRVR
jgi:DNA-binding beta-propeller fold protein YncE